MMHRTPPPLVMLLAVAVMITFACRDDAGEPRPLANPNVLVIVIDSLRADHVGGESSVTPNLDRLAAEGARFEYAVSASSQSISSLVTLLTSLPPAQHGVVDEAYALSSDALTLPEVMKERGFATAAFVEGERFASGRGLEQGFETFAWKPLGASRDRADEISKWFRDWNGTGPARPFFAFVHIPLATSAAGAEREAVAAYANRVKEADERARHIIAVLDALAPENDTLVIVTSDRGHDFERPGSLHEPAVQVPLIFRFPSRLDPGRVFPDLARTMDLGPTIMMLARVRRPDAFGFGHPARGIEMRDLTEVLVGVPPDLPFITASHGADGSRSLRQGPYKLIRKAGSAQDDPYDLFNFELDPEERNDLFDAEPRRAAVYVKKLSGWLEICADRPRYAIPYRP
ncbi:MAG: sulfatase-like hydrolase/transferase [bacterium]|nr:sulfatase-like hydrolase/transferase [bacterium]